MQAWGKVRARKRNGRTTYWVDVRPVARIWTTPNGQTFKRRSQAEAVLADIRRAVAVDGKTREAAVSFYLARTSPRLRVGYAYGQWIARMRETAARGDCTSSYVDHLERYGRHLGALADVHYQHVTFARLEDLDAALAKRLQPKTRAHVLAALRTFLRWMKRRGMIETLPEFPVVTVPDTDGPHLEPEQQRAVLEAIPADRRAIFLALAFHGLRPSEAARLDTPADYDWRSGVARLPGPKAKDRRAALVPFGEELRGLLESAVSPEQRIDGGPLFRNPRGIRRDKRWTLDTLETTWNRACATVGVRCSLYRGTKHSSATAARRRGVPLDQIQAALRHADIRSTAKYARAADLTSVEVLDDARPGGHDNQTRREGPREL
jgi:integrase